MNKIFSVIVLLVAIQARAQTNFKDNLAYYKENMIDEVPAGTKVTFLEDIVFPKGVREIAFGKLKSGPSCLFNIPEAKDVPQMIPKGTVREVTGGRSTYGGFYINDRKTVVIFCQTYNFTIGEIVESFQDKLQFELGPPPKTEIYVFP